MHRRVVMLALAGSAAAFMPGAFVGSTPALAKATSGLRLRSGRTSIKMVDWDWDKKEEEDNYDGPGSERGQINRSDEIGARSKERLENAKKQAAEAASTDTGYGSVSGLAAGRSDLKEGDRDPVTGRLILDPLKIPTKDQGAPGTWEEYLKMRQAKEGGTARDVMGNVIDDVKPTYAVQDGTWGPPKEAQKENLDDIFGKKPVSEPVFELDPELERQKAERAAEASKQQDEVEARMAKWMAEAAAKKAAEGGN